MVECFQEFFVRIAHSFIDILLSLVLESFNRVKFEQATRDIQYKALFTDHEKRRAAYARKVTRAYDLLMSQNCGDVMKERLETRPDYDTMIRDKPIAALQQIWVLAHNPTRGKYHYACIYKSLEQMVNIQQKDNEAMVCLL